MSTFQAHQWRKSTRSQDREDCVEQAFDVTGELVGIRDTKQAGYAQRDQLVVSAHAWHNLTAAIKDGRLA